MYGDDKSSEREWWQDLPEVSCSTCNYYADGQCWVYSPVSKDPHDNCPSFWDKTDSFDIKEERVRRLPDQPDCPAIVG